MRTKFIYILAILLMAGMVSCSDDKIVIQINGLEVKGSIARPDVPKSRVSLDLYGESVNCQWTAGDTIGLISEDGTIDNIPFVACTDGSDVSFRVADGYDVNIKDGMTVYAYFPYRKGCNNGTSIDVSTKETWSSNYTSYRIGECALLSVNDTRLSNFRDIVTAKGKVSGKTLNLKFEHIFTFLKIRIPNSRCISDRDANWASIRITHGSTTTHSAPYIIDLATGEVADGAYYTMNADINPLAENIKNGEDIIMYAAFPPKVDRNREYFTVSTTGSKDMYLNYPEDGFKPGVMYVYDVDQKSLDEFVEREYNALMALYNSANGKDWFRGECNWSRDIPLYDWNGVYTEIPDPYNWPEFKAKFVTGLNLDFSNVTGQLPEELENLTFLEELIIRNDYGATKIGVLPKSLANLRHLRWLSLRSCKAEGRLVDYFPIVKPGQELDLSDNLFTGPLPEIDPEFKRIDFAVNNLTGTIPASWKYYLDKLMPQDFPYIITGIPYEVIVHNRLSGHIPPEVVNHPRFNTLITSLVQQDGYGFDPVPIKWSTDRMILSDGSIFDLGKSYSKHEYTMIINAIPSYLSSTFWHDMNQLYLTYKDRGLQLIITSQQPIWPNISVYDVYGPQFDACREIMDDDVVFIDPYSYEGSKWSGSNSPEMAFTMCPTIGLPTVYYSPESANYAITIIDRNGYYVGSYQPVCNLTAKYNTFPLYLQPEIFNYVARLFGDDKYRPVEIPYYTSTDYSHDGEVITLQRATTGKGIDVILMGSGYVDLDMEQGGAYERDMQEMCDALFRYEPYQSLRDRFNVYAVKAVSANREFGGGTSHVFDSADGTSYVNTDKILEYATKAPFSDVPYVGVIYNANQNEVLSRSYTMMFEDNSAIAYIFEKDMSVFIHEMCGHALGKLADEYVETSSEINEYSKEVLTTGQAKGWYLNVDITDDPKTVRWSHFLADKRYEAEGLGCYEGGYTYQYGVWRPSMNSMMRYNDCGFNAPSREIIYKRVMQITDGPGWKYDFEEFYKFDRNNISRSSNEQQRRTRKSDIHQRTAKPIIVKGTWRDHEPISDR